MDKRTGMEKTFDAACTPTSCVYAKNCAVPAKKARNAALEEAANIVHGYAWPCPCCRSETLEHLDGCTFIEDGADESERRDAWLHAKAAIRALKEVE